MQEIIYKMDNWTIIKLLGGITIVITSIIGFFSKYLLNRFSQSSSHSYNSKIESLKGEINKNNNLLTSLTQNYFSSSQKILDKKIQAYELLWTTIINIKNSFPAGISLVYQLLTYNEITEENAFEKLDRNPKMGPLLRSYEMVTEMSKITNDGKSLLNLKPYITDNTYKLFYTYQGLLGRVTHKFIWNFQNNKLYDWKKDEALKGILKITLTEKELNYIINIEINSLHSLIELIEYKILQDFRNSLNIKDSTNDTVEYLKDIETILNKNE
ncbi:MAG: hypothetical protein V4572_05155 [Bacteroidota bacterium]